MTAEHFHKLQENILQIAQKYNVRPPKIVAVSKNHSVDAIQTVYNWGQRDFGENRVQELMQKVPLLPHDIRWHLIGKLQTNKVKYIAPFIHLIHSVDSEKLLAEIQKQAQKHSRKISVLIQINISNEPQKNGCSYEEAQHLLQNINHYPLVQVKGLMGIAENADDKEVIKKQFFRLRDFFEQCKALSNEQVQMEELSIGMSGDYEIAIQAHSTMLRIGTAIFGDRT